MKHFKTVWSSIKFFDVYNNGDDIIKNMFLLNDEFTQEHEKIYRDYEQSKKIVKELVGGKFKFKNSLQKFKFKKSLIFL